MSDDGERRLVDEDDDGRARRVARHVVEEGPGPCPYGLDGESEGGPAGHPGPSERQTEGDGPGELHLDRRPPAVDVGQKAQQPAERRYAQRSVDRYALSGR